MPFCSRAENTISSMRVSREKYGQSSWKKEWVSFAKMRRITSSGGKQRGWSGWLSSHQLPAQWALASNPSLIPWESTGTCWVSQCCSKGLPRGDRNLQRQLIKSLLYLFAVQYVKMQNSTGWRKTFLLFFVFSRKAPSGSPGFSRAGHTCPLCWQGPIKCP